MRDMKLTISEQALFDLIQVALWNHSPQMDYSSFQEDIWTKIYRLSIKQGVCGIVFDGVCQLEPTVQPPANLFLTWAANTKLAEVRYRKINEVVNKLNDTLNKKGIQMLLLKGRTIAEYYPNPSHREYGDIDIHLGGNFDKGAAVLLENGTFKDSSDKHQVCIYDGFPVENHRSFIDKATGVKFFATKRKRAFAEVEDELHRILSDGKKCHLTNIVIPPPTFIYIFLLMHAGVHLPNELVVRHLCDWACFLYRNKGEYDEERIKKVLKYLNFGKFSNLLTYIAIRYIGLPQEYAPSFYSENIDAQLESQCIRNLFYHFPGANEVTNNTMFCKWKRFYSKQWSYSLFYKEFPLERLIYTLTIWIQKKRKQFFNH